MFTFFSVSMSNKIKCTDEQIIVATNETSSASAAAQRLGIKYETYKKYAIRLGIFKTNQAGKGISKPICDDRKFLLSDILNGKYPHYHSNKLRIRLIESGIKNNKCESCGLSEWLGMKMRLELDHIDGNRYNHRLENLRILCPNCHSLTETYRGKNKSKNNASVVEQDTQLT